jgi:hypothetical protein
MADFVGLLRDWTQILIFTCINMFKLLALSACLVPRIILKVFLCVLG